MSFGNLQTFFDGLGGLLGPPHPNLLEAMQDEHTDRIDSRSAFCASNYGTTSTSEIEWYFCADPEGTDRTYHTVATRAALAVLAMPAVQNTSILATLRYLTDSPHLPYLPCQGGLEKLGLQDYPLEQRLVEHDGRARSRCRVARPLSAYDVPRRGVNRQLLMHKSTALLNAEFLGARLYTGPLFVK